jgi:hypothetical protein
LAVGKGEGEMLHFKNSQSGKCEGKFEFVLALPSPLRGIFEKMREIFITSIAHASNFFLSILTQ